MQNVRNSICHIFFSDDISALVCSDEEEFPDDHILRDLRAKRQGYITQLQHIEAALQQLPHEQQQ